MKEKIIGTKKNGMFVLLLTILLYARHHFFIAARASRDWILEGIR